MARRFWPIVTTALVLATGMVFIFAWNPLVHHNGSWATGGDLWGIYRGAHYVAWGSLGAIYTGGTGIVAFPGMSVLLAPVAAITGHFHMTESYGPFFIPRPTAALVLMPVELLLASTAIFASDALAERLEVGRRRRIWLCLTVGAVVWPVAEVWGHAEDPLAVALAIYAMIAMLNRKWAVMGWLFGLGILMQPLVALLLPLFIGASPRGQRFLLAVRASALSVVLVGVAFAGDASDTYRQLVQQPTPPSINHATPWVALAPHLTSTGVQTIHRSALVSGGLGHAAVKAVTVTGVPTLMVSGGPGRMIDVVLAFLLGVFVWRRPQPPIRLLWLAAVVLASRCFFEPVMTPYYLAPPLILCLIMLARQRGKRFWPGAAIALETTVFSYHHLNPWIWWLPIVAGLIALLALGYPGDIRARAEPSDELSDAPTGVEPDRSETTVPTPGDREPALI
jgi:hypothetical protein